MFVEHTNLRRSAAEVLVRLGPARIVVLGGRAAVSESNWWVLAGYLG